MIKKFPWMADQLRRAYSDVKTPKQPAVRSRPASSCTFRRCQSPEMKKPTEPENDEPKTKVVFRRNIPMFVYNSKTAIRVGGDLTSDHMTEEVHKALEYNPELKKVTMDIQDLSGKRNGRSIHLAVSYLSATANHNPLVISEHMARFSAKREKLIKHSIQEVEARLLSQRKTREKKDERWRQQLEKIVRARMEAEEKENDFLLAKKQLEESRQMNAEVLTSYERQQERRRRIQLRSKAIPVIDRVKKKKPTKFQEVSSSSH